MWVVRMQDHSLQVGPGGGGYYCRDPPPASMALYLRVSGVRGGGQVRAVITHGFEGGFSLGGGWGGGRCHLRGWSPLPTLSRQPLCRWLLRRVPPTPPPGLDNRMDSSESLAAPLPTVTPRVGRGAANAEPLPATSSHYSRSEAIS